MTYLLLDIIPLPAYLGKSHLWLFASVACSLTGFPCSSVGKELAYSTGDLGLIPGLGRSPGGGNDNPLQYSCPEKEPGGAGGATVHNVTKSQTQLKGLCMHTHIAIKRTLVSPSGTSAKESACHCRRCKRLWFNPWVRKIPRSWRWQPTPVFLAGQFHGQHMLLGYSPWCHKSQTQLSD